MRKYDPNGGELWTRQFGTVANDQALAVAVDSTGVYVAGHTNAALPGQTLGSPGVDDAFVRKYDRNGNELWTRQFGTASTEQAHGVAADSTGVYVVGNTNGPLGLPSTIGAFDAFIRKYDANGNAPWTRQFGTAANDYAWAVAASSSGIYAAGRTDGAFPGQTNASPGVRDAFVRKFDSAGSDQWTRQFGTQGQDEALGVAADATGVTVVGNVNFALPGATGNTAAHAFARRRSWARSTPLLWRFPPPPFLRVSLSSVRNHSASPAFSTASRSARRSRSAYRAALSVGAPFRRS